MGLIPAGNIRERVKMMKKIDIIFALFYYILEGKRIGEPDKNMGSNIRKRNDFSKHQQILDLDHREVKFHFFTKNTIKIWLSAKTQYLSAFSREQIHQFTTYLLPLNEPWYASFPRYAKIWYSTSVLKQEKNWIFYRLWNA